jgi:signal transduction histidine kinase
VKDSPALDRDVKDTRPRRLTLPGGLRTKISSWNALILALALTLASAVIFEAFKVYQHRETEQELIEEIVDFRSYLAARPAGQTPQAATYAYLANWPSEDREALVVRFRGEAPRAGGQIGIEDAVVQALARPGPRFDTVITSKGEAQVLVTPVTVAGDEIGTIASVYFLTEERAAVVRTLGVVASVAVLAFLLAAGVAWPFAGRLLHPLVDMARTASTIAEVGDLTRRIAPSVGRDEVGQLTLAFNRMLDRLEAAFRRERRFIREASHELRTPITICRGHLEVLGESPSSEELRETIALVVEELGRMSRVVEDMTTLARAEAPDFLRPQPVTLDRFLDEVAVKAETLMTGRLSVERVPTGATLMADPQRLTQALINLLQNAAVHTPPHTPVTLRLVPERQAWRFEVADEGGGLSPALEDTVFQPFRRGNTGAPGSGLGLAIVKGIAEAHGGSAGLDNRPGHGATFWIRVPR